MPPLCLFFTLTPLNYREGGKEQGSNMKEKVLLALYHQAGKMRSMNNTGSTSTVVSITDRLYNIVEELHEMEMEISACIDASNARDFIPDENMVEWHPISVTRDQRWDSMDVAHTKIVDTIAHLTTAHTLSIKVDQE